MKVDDANNFLFHFKLGNYGQCASSTTNVKEDTLWFVEGDPVQCPCKIENSSKKFHIFMKSHIFF